MKSLIRRVVRAAVSRAVSVLGLSQKDQTIIRDAQYYWSDSKESQFETNSHWRSGLEDSTWYSLGKIHLDMFKEAVALTGFSLPCERMIEWGCGGGANAIHFAGLTRQFVGVEVSQSSLDECDNVLRQEGHEHFYPILIEVGDPEAALDHAPGPCDFFLCTYVLELVPTPEYGRRLVAIARQLLRPGGIALIQIKYATHKRHTQPRRWSYRANLAQMTTYPIDVFWELAVEEGFKPRYVTLQPKQPLIHDERYAYFVLERLDQDVL